jgi:hypothetical protein
MRIFEKFISPEDLKAVQDYLATIKFNTKEDHVPLHDGLFAEDGTKFDIHTRGEMPDHILEVFSKYSKGMYEGVLRYTSEEYHPPMFSKHYIARYRPGSYSNAHFNMEKPEGTYGSYLVWQNPISGGRITFPNYEANGKVGLDFIATPGDLIVFEETEKDTRGIQEILEGEMFISEAWMGKKGQHWMQNRSSYEETEWDDWEIKGFHE